MCHQQWACSTQVCAIGGAVRCLWGASSVSAGMCDVGEPVFGVGESAILEKYITIS